ncbi:hypothetical protein [Streptomyces sp. NPDC048309]
MSLPWSVTGAVRAQIPITGRPALAGSLTTEFMTTLMGFRVQLRRMSR